MTRRLEEQAREHAQAAQTGHEHHMAGSAGLSWRQRLTSARAWSDVAHNFRGDVEMLWREITAGFLIAGFVALLPMSFFNGLFLTDAPAWIRIPENVVVGPLVAILSFVCSVGNVPLAAVLWAGGISFSGVIAFIYADLLIVPILLVYRKYYGGRMAALISGIMFGSIVLAALARERDLRRGGVDPVGPAGRGVDHGRGIAWNYTTVLNIVFFGIALRRLWGADAPAWRARPRLRDDRRPQHVLYERLARADVLLLRGGLQGPVRCRPRALPRPVAAACPCASPLASRRSSPWSSWLPPARRR